MPQRLASSATASCAWRFVPKKRMVLPLPLCSLTKRAASRNSFNVFCRSMMWIPLRSPKIYSFIFGFQRRVWGAERNSSLQQFFHRYFNCQSPSSGDRCLRAPDRFVTKEVRNRTSYCRLLAGREFVPRIQDRTLGLTLAELEALAGALLPVLLAFLHARIARQKTVLAQARAQFRIEERQRAGKPHAHRARLPTHAAAIHGRDNVNGSRRLGELHRLDGAIAPGNIAKIFIRCAAIDGDFTRSERQENARDRFLAPAGPLQY